MAGQVGHSATLTWVASTNSGEVGFSGYNVYRSEVGGTETTPALNGATPITGLTFVDNTVEAGKTYFYVVTAIEGGLESVHSVEVSGTIPFFRPAAPTGLTIVVV